MRILRALSTASIAIVLLTTLPVAANAAEPTEAVRVCVLKERSISTISRITGPDRFAVSANVSSVTFESGVPIAYIASGTTFPDALSGSAAAGLLGGPVLLVAGGSEAPAVIRDELTRLKPKEIVVLGGTAAVSAELERSLVPFAPTVRRIAGADRFAVSAAIAHEVFESTSSVIHVASGENFPDALSASAAAGDVQGPVLLVQKNGIPASIRAELEAQTGLREIVVLGGRAAVSDEVVAALSAYAPVERRSGADRFEVSAETSEQQFCDDNRAVVYIASGETFPDALSGSVAAITRGGPVLLVRRDGIPASIDAELRRLVPEHIVVLGGEKAVSRAVAEQLEGYLAE